MNIKLLMPTSRGRMTRVKSKPPDSSGRLAGTKPTTKSVLHLNNILSGDKKQEVKIQADLILKAMSKGDGGAMRLYFLAKTFNHYGSGTIRLLEFWHFLKAAGLDRSTYERWLNRAVAVGLFKRRDKKQIELGDLAGIVKAALLFDCEITSPEPQLITLKTLISKGWAFSVWACYIKQFEGKAISQGKLEKYTGIAPRMQRIYEHKAGVQIKRNYVIMQGHGASELAGVREHKHAGAFIHQGEIMYRTSNTREVVPAMLANKGSQQKIKKSIRALAKYWVRDNRIRLFNKDIDKLNDMLGYIGKLSKQGKETPDYLFLETRKPGIWEEVAVN